VAQSCSAAVTTGWQQLRLATARHQAGSPPTSGSFDVLLRARDREHAILRGRLPPPIPAKSRYSDDQHVRRVRSADGDAHCRQRGRASIAQMAAGPQIAYALT